jgi:hypothetical protein
VQSDVAHTLFATQHSKVFVAHVAAAQDDVFALRVQPLEQFCGVHEGKGMQHSAIVHDADWQT